MIRIPTSLCQRSCDWFKPSERYKNPQRYFCQNEKVRKGTSGTVKLRFHFCEGYKKRRYTPPRGADL